MRLNGKDREMSETMQKVVTYAAAVLVSIVVCTVVLFVMLSLGKQSEKEEQGERFVTVEKNFSYFITYDKETGVMYAVSNGINNAGTFTLLVDKDGKPLIYEGGR
jgi:hypothetical protein